MNKFKIFCILTVFAFILCSCSEKKVEYFGDVNNVSETTISSESDEGETTPPQSHAALKYNNFQNASTISNVIIKRSYFYSKMDKRFQSVYDEVVNGSIVFKDYIPLSESVTKDELSIIMNIILTNEPLLFNLDFKYKFDVDINGNVKNVYPCYILTEQEYSEIKNSFEEDMVNFSNDYSGKDEYSALIKIYDTVSNICNTRDIGVPPYENYKNGSESKGCYSQTIINKTLYSLGAAKLVSLYCNYAGIENMTVLGECITDGPEKACYPTLPSNITEDNGIFTSIPNLNNYHAWNIVKVGGIYTNIDAWLSAYLIKNNDYPEYCLFCVSDEIIRQTNLFRPTYELLGQTPPCTSNNFSYLYRNSYYMKALSDNDISIYLDDLLNDLYFNKPDKAVIQFETEPGYLIASKLIEKKFVDYNKTNNDKIPKYKIVKYEKSLVIKIENILYT